MYPNVHVFNAAAKEGEERIPAGEIMMRRCSNIFTLETINKIVEICRISVTHIKVPFYDCVNNKNLYVFVASLHHSHLSRKICFPISLLFSSIGTADNSEGLFSRK